MVLCVRLLIVPFFMLAKYRKQSKHQSADDSHYRTSIRTMEYYTHTHTLKKLMSGCLVEGGNDGKQKIGTGEREVRGKSNFLYILIF